VAKNPAQYGLDAVAIEPPLEPDVVTTNYAVDLRLVAEAVDSTVEEISDLNPALIRRITPRDLAYDLKLPHGTKDRFEEAMLAIPADKRVAWRYHKIADGETLSSVAKRYRVSESAITQVNNLESDDIHAGAKLVIPASGKVTLAQSGGTYAKKPTRYKVRKGDTVLSIADDFGVPADRLRRWNRLKGNSLHAGRTLYIYKPVSAEETPSGTASKKKHSTKKATKKASATKKSSSTSSGR
jgi:membrane-bound lytic murein transglycosylase D